MVGHTKRVNVIVEPLGELLADRMVTASTYQELKPGLASAYATLQQRK